ncbi:MULTISPECIES: hypothetical protein [Gordonibacter]|uniref:DUF2229 domain-containing protein n=1 Tax=Gordonibacter faecis TaxID=3047475 RepID=A0ABT7DQN0_9ACTN|nr:MULTISPECIES: hypothetical protein [unclassified Gordonibacter]MDJ1651527.1 hypothetical protein [Gordonibacter sp. KGMB12511]
MAEMFEGGAGAENAPATGGAAPAASNSPTSDDRTRSGFTLFNGSDDDSLRARIALQLERKRPPRLLPPRPRQPKRDRHARTRVAFLRYSYYDIVFKFFVEQVLDADYLPLPEPTKRTVELGSRNASDYVCAPFKHILGDYIEALELGADVLVQFAGPCRLGYYGELQESILRDMGYEFQMLNFATVTGKPLTEYIEVCKKTVNPNLSVPRGVRGMLAVFKMIECLDEAQDFYLAHAGFEVERGSFDRTLAAYHADMRAATTERDIAEAQRRGMEALRALPLRHVERPVRVGVVGEYFTAVDPHSNLGLERKLLDMGVEVHRLLNMTNRNLRYHEKNLRASIADYVRYDMGPTSSMTIAATLKYAQEGFDGVVHLKSSGCTPEVDCIPVLQQVSRDTGMPILYLSYDSQTSDTGLDTRLEAFYDMLAMKKEKTR